MADNASTTDLFLQDFCWVCPEERHSLHRLPSGLADTVMARAGKPVCKAWDAAPDPRRLDRIGQPDSDPSHHYG